MKRNDFIAVTDFCASHNISHAFIVELRDYGLVEIVEKGNLLYLPLEELQKTEKIVRLHSDLDINLEGIEVITRLLNSMQELHNQMMHLRNRLDLYE
ncbi:MAG: chaperone modulator CbpM [Maribacter sp.]|nr:chaperone modulator CbpM [Maribacter sp.]